MTPNLEFTRINIRQLVDACRIYIQAGMSKRAAECARRAARYGRRLLEARRDSAAAKGEA